VGICVKNSEGTIKSTLNSVIAQDFPLSDMEIIIVDGNSHDRTLEIAHDVVAATEINSRIMSDFGEGLGAARQIVVENALGEFIVWVDSDVILARDFMQKQLGFLEKNPNIGMARGKSEKIESAENLLTDVQNLFFRVANVVYMGATICRTGVLRKIGGFDKHIRGAAEDTDLKIRMTQKGWKTATNNEAKFTHFPRGTLRSSFAEYAWFGYGGHFINHKHGSLAGVVSGLPPILFGWGLKLSRRSYRQFQEKKSFLIPLLCLFISLTWWYGFTRSHIDGYGH
jgi:glycosyltransferase involved in cell wall biosynthesis